MLIITKLNGEQIREKRQADSTEFNRRNDMEYEPEPLLERVERNIRSLRKMNEEITDSITLLEELSERVDMLENGVVDCEE